MMTPEPGARIGVIRGGRMGAGIAHAFAAAGCAVTLIEPDADGQRAHSAGSARSSTGPPS
jgi:3-hydroxybutyryl-CoA dehydrogenase